MNTLRKLFAPRALVAAAASAMLVHSTIVVLAEGCYSTSAVRQGEGTQCVATCWGDFQGVLRYWCCASLAECSGPASYDPPMGWCCPSQ